MQGGHNGGTRAAKAAIEVSFDGGAFGFRYVGKGFDATGNVTVRGPKGRRIPFVFTLLAGAGVVDVWFPASAAAALQVDAGKQCPPASDNPQFIDKSTRPSHPGGVNDVLHFTDTMQDTGEYAYAVTVEALLPNGIIRQVTHDPMVANRPD